MNAMVGTLNLILGLVYTSYGIMTWFDLRHGWGDRGRSHFGMAWLFMAFTCGPHHLDHGLHVLLGGASGGALDLFAVAAGFPAGVTWFLLRLEAVKGGRGDRAIGELPAWVEALPSVGMVYGIGLATAVLLTLSAGPVFDVRLLPNLTLVGLYTVVGAVVLRTQISNHRVAGSWSLSGLSLGIVFPTCAAMHGVWAVYAATGRYAFDAHLLTIDVLAIPAAVYFLWVVLSLTSGRLTDWHTGADGVRPQHVEAEPGPMPLAGP